MNPFLNIDNEAFRLLHPHSILTEFLFDEQQNMKENLRLRLLKQADFIINKTLVKFPGLIVKDIVLAGSSASYLYHPDSDIDISIIVKNETCTFLSQDQYLLMLFLISLFSAFNNEGYYFELDGRHIDFNILDGSKNFLPDFPNHLFGLYSLKNNCWINRPSNIISEEMTVGNLVSGYFEKLEEIYRFMGNLTINGDVYSQESLQKMHDYYYKLKSDFTYSSNKNYLISKLLSSQKIFHELGKNITNSYRTSIISDAIS